MVRYGGNCPGEVATYYRDGKKIHSFRKGAGASRHAPEFMEQEGFDWQVLIPDNRPLDLRSAILSSASRLRAPITIPWRKISW